MFIDTRTIQTANIQSSSSSSSSPTFNAGLSPSLNQVFPTIAGSSTPVAGVLDLDVLVARSDGSTSNSNSASSSAGADSSRRRGLVPFKRLKSKLAKSEFKSMEGTDSEGDKLKDSEGGDRLKMRRKKGGHGEDGVGGDGDKNKTGHYYSLLNRS